MNSILSTKLIRAGLAIFVLLLISQCALFQKAYAEEASSGDVEVLDTLRVFNWNIRHGRGMDNVVDIRRQAEVIRSKNLHIVTLQEVDKGVRRTSRIDLMKVFSGYLGMEPVFHKIMAHQGGDFGNGILVNLPLISDRNLLYVSAEGVQRGLQQVEVLFHGDTLAIMNTHLDHRSETDRQSSVEQIIETKRAYRRSPVILAGDINARPDTEVVARLNEFFVDVWDVVGDGPGYTARPNDPNRRIDYIFYTNNLTRDGGIRLRPIKIEVVQTEASDHLPIYAEFEVYR